MLQNCDIHAQLPDSCQKNMVTIQGRTNLNQNISIIIQKSRIGATSDLQPKKSSYGIGNNIQKWLVHGLLYLGG